uniref:Uncharacterized protein n=1 Tax=Ciona savignyi TaxID=51511 RepID=H2Z9Z3_CIOSA
MNVFGFPVESAVFLVCHYGPRGIRFPHFPYFRGTTCSFCNHEDKCEYNLCANTERETDDSKRPWLDETTNIPTTTTPAPFLSKDAKIGLIAGGAVLASTLIATAIIVTVVRTMRRKERERMLQMDKRLNNMAGRNSRGDFNARDE